MAAISPERDIALAARAAGAHDRDPRAATGRPRVAILSPWHPVPVDNGSKQRLRNIIDTLAPDYELLLITLDDRPEHDRAPLADVPGVNAQATVPMPRWEPRSPRALLAALGRAPRSFTATWDPAAATAVRGLLDDFGAKLVIGADLRVVQYTLVADCRVPTIMAEANVSPFLLDESSPTGRLARLRARLRQRRYARFLRDAFGRLDIVAVPSWIEAQAAERLTGAVNVEVIPNGVSHFPEPWTPPATNLLLYTGSLTYAPNLDAVSWFTYEVLPLVQQAVPTARLVVTGALPRAGATPRRPDIELTGVVDSLDRVYRESRVFVAPLRAGTGTRIKLLEAMAIGMPVVTTRKGAEGLPVEDGVHALVADDPAAFAGAVVRLLRDDRLAAELGAGGRAFVREHGAWQHSGDQLRALVARLLADGG